MAYIERRARARTGAQGAQSNLGPEGCLLLLLDLQVMEAADHELDGERAGLERRRSIRQPSWKLEGGV